MKLKYTVFLCLAVLLILAPNILLGQNVIFKYSFDDCSFEDDAMSFPGLTPGGSPECVCGLGAKSYRLDGNDDILELSDQANSQMQNDFTFDFYFRLDNTSGEVDIFSLRNGCSGLDSLMSLRYFAANDEYVFEIGSNVNNYHTAKAKPDNSKCWHRFTLVKFNLEYRIYFDNALIKKIISRENIVFTKLAKLKFSNSPCTAGLAVKHRGNLDEITLYDRALSDNEIRTIYEFPDRIKTPNTTIFKGQSIRLEGGQSCASGISWSPAQSLDNPNVINPLATPDATTTYELRLNDGGCQSTDSVTVYVAEKDSLNCDKLLLPKAFTPNNDGLNDLYGISNTFLPESLDFFEIYDRWGEKVWETTEITGQWDGTKGGSPLGTGMYLYRIKYKCNSDEKLDIGNFNLLR